MDGTTTGLDIFKIELDQDNVKQLTFSSAMMSLTLDTALRTPLPKYLVGSPSRSSTASCCPVDAPEGTEASALHPHSRITSTATVGVPLESRISRDFIFFIFIIEIEMNIISTTMTRRIMAQ